MRKFYINDKQETIPRTTDFDELSIEERRNFERQKYLELKVHRKGVVMQDDSEYYYVINSSWIEEWQNFMKYGNAIPKEINN